MKNNKESLINKNMIITWQTLKFGGFSQLLMILSYSQNYALFIRHQRSPKCNYQLLQITKLSSLLCSFDLKPQLI